jgi:diaminohydroxyphosphoribosylaminopyrimidine deaminase / 5-amino-6-(5-phosphoribosylamino)uracil reductase
MNRVDEDLRWMRRCLELAARGGRAVEPNPRVGSVVVKDGRVIGEGWHECLGGSHAERKALGEVSEDPAGATLYVSLEPCHLYGRTPPCTEAILEAGITRVVYAMDDPNPAESGMSKSLLQAAGLEVESGILMEDARELNPGYLSLQERGRPFITLKSAGTLNGMLARADGSSKWITGEDARREGHRLRATAGAVAVGAETARLDHPALDLRLIDDTDPPPRPVVFEGAESLCPVDLNWQDRKPLLLVPDSTDRSAHEAAGWKVLHLPKGESAGVDLSAAMFALADEGIANLMVEGGGRLLTSFISAGLWDRWEHFMAAKVFPADGRPLWTLPTDGPTARIKHIERRGENLQISLIPEGEN